VERDVRTRLAYVRMTAGRAVQGTVRPPTDLVIHPGSGFQFMKPAVVTGVSSGIGLATAAMVARPCSSRVWKRPTTRRF
jgi:hypothetical protein